MVALPWELASMWTIHLEKHSSCVHVAGAIEGHLSQTRITLPSTVHVADSCFNAICILFFVSLICLEKLFVYVFECRSGFGITFYLKDQLKRKSFNSDSSFHWLWNEIQRKLSTSRQVTLSNCITSSWVRWKKPKIVVPVQWGTGFWWAPWSLPSRSIDTLRTLSYALKSLRCIIRIVLSVNLACANIFQSLWCLHSLLRDRGPSSDDKRMNLWLINGVT